MEDNLDKTKLEKTKRKIFIFRITDNADLS